MAKLAVACCNQNISRGARRKVLFQLQVDIIRVIEDEEPISVGLTRKPAQTCLHRSLSIYWGNGLEIRLNSVFIRGVDVEDIKEAYKISSLANDWLILFDQLAYRLSLDSSINLNASWLFPAPPRPCNTKMR